MALTSTIFSVSVDLSDIDRSVYETIALRVAMHPSESPEYLATRLLAYCLEYTEGIEMTAGLSNGEEPAIVVRDLTGRMTAWIDIGLPDAERLHRASKLVPHVAVYTHRARLLMEQLAGRTIHRAEQLGIYGFDAAFIRDFAERIERRTSIALSVTERHLYVDVAGVSLTTIVEEHRLVT